MSELEQKIPKTWLKRYRRKMMKIHGTDHIFPDQILPNAIDRIFFFGDLNYRVQLSRLDILRGIMSAASEPLIKRSQSERFKFSPRRSKSEKSKDFSKASLKSILGFDQLKIERSLRRCFRGFSEAEILFMPSFKYDKNSDRYDTSSKMRAPAWTDRILYRPGGKEIENLAYQSVLSAKHSDHRPVVGTFDVMLLSK
mmetsp:Transcript_19776/g.29272  ORF Transcript_19776/g.29272 Transcript_19776/m.29272 type:complete len:197 (-) Transcript_19776:207-797(-)